jgi:hypothetical protein
MPKPREMGNVTRHVIQGMVRELKLTRRQLRRGALAAHATDRRLVAKEIQSALIGVDAAISAGTLLLADDQKQAEVALDEAKAERKTTR